MRTNATQRLLEITKIDRPYWDNDIPFAGIDEAGRGPLAGPVYAGCVVMPKAPLIPGIDDSKRLSEKKRESLYGIILETALFAQVGFATVQEIEQLNIRNATKLAMERAAIGAPCSLFLIDAETGVLLPGEQQAILHGDALCYAIAAASILAKVTRDRYMYALDTQYPQYGFAKHKGYGTAAHIAALKTYGPCPEHRNLFIRKFVSYPSVQK